MTQNNEPAREIRAYSTDSIAFNDEDLYDFRPQPLPADVVEEELPKDSPATEPVKDSDSPSSEPQPPEPPASASKVKSPAKTGS